MSSVIAFKKPLLTTPLFEKVLTASMMFIGLFILPSLSWSAQPDAFNAQEQQQYQIQDFSDDYYAIIKPKANEATNEDSESNSTIDVIDSKTKQTLISQSADIDIEYELDNSQEHQLGNKISANIVSIPYGEHSVLIYDDFDFDGQKDLALRDGRYGCYGGPSYQVYLKDGNTFAHSDDFTELVQGYCGFFDIDEDTQTLHTMTKSGAAWHQYSEYKVIDNKPVAVHIVAEEYNQRGLISITESTRVNGKMVVDNYEVLPMYDDPQADGTSPFIYRFDLDKGKKMVLGSGYGNDTEQLYYALADKDGRVELFYDGDFDYDASKKTLSFTKKSVRYQINNNGITVKLPNKTVSLKSNVKSVQGSLDNLAKFKNVN